MSRLAIVCKSAVPNDQGDRNESSGRGSQRHFTSLTGIDGERACLASSNVLDSSSVEAVSASESAEHISLKQSISGQHRFPGMQFSKRLLSLIAIDCYTAYDSAKVKYDAVLGRMAFGSYRSSRIADRATWRMRIPHALHHRAIHSHAASAMWPLRADERSPGPDGVPSRLQ